MVDNPVNLSRQDIDDIGKVVATEVDHRLRKSNPAEYEKQIAGVVDTILNRVASPQFPDTVRGVVNQYKQFSSINGPPVRKGEKRALYGSVQKTPEPPSFTRKIVESHIASRMAGAASSIGGFVNYANPAHSSQSSLKSWINPMIQEGTIVRAGEHVHGNAPGFQSVEAAPFTDKATFTKIYTPVAARGAQAADAVDRAQEVASRTYDTISENRRLASLDPRARALAQGSGYAGPQRPVATVTQGDKVFADKPNMVGGGILGAANAIGNFAGNIYSRAQDAAPRPGGTVPSYSATTQRGATPPGNFRQNPAISGSGSFTPSNVPSLGGVMADNAAYNYDAGPMTVGYQPAGPNAWDGSNARYATVENSLFRENDDYTKPYVSTPSLSTFSPPSPQGGDALSRLRATASSPSMATRGGINSPQAAPVGAVQRSPLAAPQAAQPARTDALSRLRSMAEAPGDMRASPLDRSSGTYARGADPVSRDMAAQAAQPGRRSVATGGQAPQAPRAATPSQPAFRSLGGPSPLAGVSIGRNPFDTQRAAPVSPPSQPAFRSLGPATPPKSAPPSPTRQAAPGLARAVTAPASVASGTGSVLGSIGGRMLSGLNSTIAGLGAAPATPSVKTQQAAQVQQAKAATAPRPAPTYSPPMATRGGFPTAPRAGLSSLGSTLSGLSRLPAADPNKINEAAVTNALTGTLSGALTGGIPGAIAGGLWGYATTPAMANQMNSPTLADPNAFGLGSLGSMFSGGGSGRDSTGASFSRGTYSDGPGRGLSYGASASRSGTRSGPTAGRQAGGSK